MNKVLLTLMVLVICAVPLAALAEWDPSYPYTKWVQFPDPDGWDVKVTTPKILADDFECKTTGWITDIHFWGSWKHDDVGEITRIHLSIHDDIPAAESPTGYSIPGAERWSVEIDPSQYPGVEIQEWGSGLQGWHDPNTGETFWPDHYVTWQVNVFLEEADWFFQEGTPDDPVVYWLDIQVDVFDPLDLGLDFGWKTSLDHWGDYAVWADWQGPGSPKPEGDQWEELIIEEMQWDMAFVITTIPEPGLLAIAGLGLLALLRREK